MFLTLRHLTEPPLISTRLPEPGEQGTQWLMLVVIRKSDPISFHKENCSALKSVLFLGGVVEIGTVNCEVAGTEGHGVMALLGSVNALKLVNVYAQTSVHPPPSMSMSQYLQKAFTGPLPSRSNQ